MNTILDEFQPDDFINLFDVTNLSLINALVEQGKSFDQIGIEMSSYPSLGMTTKGGGQWDKGLFQKILTEVAKIICGDGEDELSKKIKSETTVTSTIITSAVSGYIGSTLGMSAALCTPFVLLSIAVILKAGKNTFCQSYHK